MSGAFAEMTTSGDVARIWRMKRQPYSTSCTARRTAEYFENSRRSAMPTLLKPLFVLSPTAPCGVWNDEQYTWVTSSPRRARLLANCT